jgi:hypothetical protein
MSSSAIIPQVGEVYLWGSEQIRYRVEQVDLASSTARLVRCDREVAWIRVGFQRFRRPPVQCLWQGTWQELTCTAPACPLHGDPDWQAPA